MPGTGDSYVFATLETNGVRDVALSLDQTLLYAAMSNGDVNVYDLVTRQKIATWHVGTELGGLSLSDDGSFLLVTERQGPANTAVLYRVATATGTATTVSMPGQAFRDVEIVDHDTAILTGNSNWNSFPGQQTLYNLVTGQFSGLTGAVSYSGGRTVLAEDKHLTLFAEPGISNGPLFLFDDRTNKVVASGDNYQTTGSGSANSGFNWGSQAISEAAGLVLQFVYYSSVNIYDLELKFLRSVSLSGRVDGMVFDPTGRYVYLYEIDSGYLAKYDVASWTRVDQIQVGASQWHNDVGYGSQLLISDDGSRITIVDSNSGIGMLRIVDLSVRNEIFEGTGGPDAFAGGKGDDVYRVDHSGDSVLELAHEGDDEVRTSLASYTLGANVERLTGLSGSGQSLQGNESGNVIRGGGGDDLLAGLAGNDTLDGGAGIDFLRGGTGDDVYFVDNAGDVVEESAGEGVDEVRTSLASASLAAFANVENLTGTASISQVLTGNSGNNVITGGSGSDVLRLYDGGNDVANGGAGNDNIFFIGTLTAADVVNGGDGVDTLVIQGPYGSLALSANVTQIENVSILGGNNTSFGEPGTNRYDYVLTTNDANFAAGVQARINGAALLEGEDFTFDGSAETDAKYVVYGGKGKDTLTGGLGNDIFFYAEERFASGDVVNGGSGYDGMFLRGNYTIDFTAPGYTGLFTSIENLTLTSATDERYARGGGTEFDYNLTLSDAIVKPGEQLTISGTLLMASETMVLDASQETDGLLRLFGGSAGDTLKGGSQADLLYGGLGADVLAGNGGADSFRYQATTESDSANMDQIVDFTAGTDKIELDRIDANTLLGGDQGFSWIGSNAFSGTAGELRAYEQGGTWFVEGDVNGDSVADLVIALTLQGPTPLGAGDFSL